MKRNYLSNEQILQDCGSLFQNLAKPSELTTEMAEYGYTPEKIAQGQALFDKANAQYLKNKKETSEETSAALAYRQLLDEVLAKYQVHRKKAKIVFKEQSDTLKKLSLWGGMSRNRAGLIAEIEDLYRNLNDDTNLFEAVKTMKITSEEIAQQIEKLAKLKVAHANYLKEKGESQQATKDKDQAFAHLEKWVRDFYAIARIALEDRPQLLEIVGKLAKS